MVVCYPTSSNFSEVSTGSTFRSSPVRIIISYSEVYTFTVICFQRLQRRLNLALFPLLYRTLPCLLWDQLPSKPQLDSRGDSGSLGRSSNPWNLPNSFRSVNSSMSFGSKLSGSSLSTSLSIVAWFGFSDLFRISTSLLLELLDSGQRVLDYQWRNRFESSAPFAPPSQRSHNEYTDLTTPGGRLCGEGEYWPYNLRMLRHGRPVGYV